jgi:hypothetical protein
MLHSKAVPRLSARKTSGLVRWREGEELASPGGGSRSVGRRRRSGSVLGRIEVDIRWRCGNVGDVVVVVGGEVLIGRNRKWLGGTAGGVGGRDC